MATEEALAKTPKEILIGPFKYIIDFDDVASYEYDFLGVCLNRSRKIELDPRQSNTELPQTLLHEIIHALGQAYEIEEWRKHTTNSDGKVTDKIDLMASAFLQLIRNNPSFITWLQEQR